MARKLDAAAIAELKRRIAAIPPHLARAAREQLKVDAERLAERMRRTVPVDEGDLRDSISVVDTSDGQYVARVKVTAGGAATRKPVRHTEKGNAPLYDYALGVEFGYRTEDGKHVEAKPFFHSTYRQQKKRIRSAVGRAITKAAKAESIG